MDTRYVQGICYNGYIGCITMRSIRDMYIIGSATATDDDGKVKVFTGGSDDDHINSPIMSLGESKESITLYAKHSHDVAVEENLI